MGRQEARELANFLRRESRVEIDPIAVAELGRVIKAVRLPAGKPLYRKGERPAGMWLVSRGMVELYVKSGRKRHVVGLLHPGDIVADVYLILDEVPLVNARTVDEIEALFVPAEDFGQLMQRHQSLCLAWLYSFARRLSSSRTRVLEVLGRGVPERVAVLLVQESFDGQLQLPQSTIAQMLGVQRTSVNRVLKEFEREGLVELHYGGVVINDFDALRAIARRERRGSTDDPSDVPAPANQGARTPRARQAGPVVDPMST